MTRYTNHPVDDDGWTPWILPAQPIYKMACCDCGLVHDVQFEVDDRGVSMRARRNVRATAAKRRKARTLPTPQEPRHAQP